MPAVKPLFTTMYMTIASCLVIASFVSKIVNGNLTITPDDREVLDGESAYFNCSTTIYDKNIDWYFYPAAPSTAPREYVYADGNVLKRYVDRIRIEGYSVGEFNLVVISASRQDAGRYECQDDGGIGETKSAQLVVLATNPVCTSLIQTGEVVGPNSCGIKPDDIRLSCNLPYTGHIHPVMKWKATTTNESVINDTAVEYNGNSVTYSLTMKADLHLNGSSFMCETTKSATLQYRCTSDIINILYVLNDNLTVNGSVGDQIVCSANTSQMCAYKWRWVQGEDSMTESNIATLVPKKSGWHKCEATCEIRNRTCPISVMTAFISERIRGEDEDKLASDKEISGNNSSSHSRTSWIVIIVVPAVVSLTVSAILIRFRKKIRRCKTSESKREEEFPLNEGRNGKQEGESHKQDQEVIEDQQEINVSGPNWKREGESHKQDQEVIEGQQEIKVPEIETDEGVSLNEVQNWKREGESHKQDQVVIEDQQEINVSEIHGLTVLGKELFILREKSSTVEVYDSDTFDFKKKLFVKGMGNPEHIVSCTINNCLVVFDWHYEDTSRKILRIDPNDGRVIKDLEMDDRGCSCISVASDGNLILSNGRGTYLRELTPNGESIRSLHLSRSPGMDEVSQAVKLRSGLFVICHNGYSRHLSKTVSLIRVNDTEEYRCYVQVEIVKSFDEGSSLYYLHDPVYLGVEEEESIVVSDYKRVLLFNSSLKNPVELISNSSGVRKRWRVCADKSQKGRWLVANYNRVTSIIFDGGVLHKTKAHNLSHEKSCNA